MSCCLKLGSMNIVMQARMLGDTCSPASIGKTLRGLSLLAYHPGTEFLDWAAEKIIPAMEQPGFRLELIGLIRSSVHAMTSLNHDSPHLFEVTAGVLRLCQRLHSVVFMCGSSNHLKSLKICDNSKDGGVCPLITATPVHSFWFSLMAVVG